MSLFQLLNEVNKKLCELPNHAKAMNGIYAPSVKIKNIFALNNLMTDVFLLFYSNWFR